jgi:dephospho-CoA kinase
MAKLKHPLKIKQKYIRLDERSRLYGLSLPLIGLTGGIASGKSTVSNRLKELGFHIIDADALIHQIYQQQNTVSFLKNLYPEAVKPTGSIDFKVLREAFFSSKEIKESLEKFLYRELPQAFLTEAKNTESDYLIYDVPLLFEKGLEQKCDTTVTVYASRAEQSKRLKSRDKSDDQLIVRILDSQLDIDFKRENSDFVINNTSRIGHLELEIELFISSLFE